MIDEKSEQARAQLVHAARRQAIVQNQRGAHVTLGGGIGLFALGTAAIAGAIWAIGAGVPISLIAAGIAIDFFALVRIGRGIYGLVAARRQLRGLEDSRLPVARVVR